MYMHTEANQESHTTRNQRVSTALIIRWDEADISDLAATERFLALTVKWYDTTPLTTSS